MSTMSDYLRRQAAKCIGWSRECFDLEAARRFRQMADEFRAKASEIDGNGHDEPRFEYRFRTANGAALQAGGDDP